MSLPLDWLSAGALEFLARSLPQFIYFNSVSLDNQSQVFVIAALSTFVSIQGLTENSFWFSLFHSLWHGGDS